MANLSARWIILLTTEMTDGEQQKIGLNRDGSSPFGPSNCYTALSICPVTLEEANEFVARHHRHHDPVTGHKFSIGLSDFSRIRGIAIVGRPVARMMDDGWTLEVNRCCTDGVRNGCSMLYQAAWRAARSMGYRRLITYTLAKEGGASLRGAGWKLVGERGGGSWHRQWRPRVDTHPLQIKMMWEAV